MSSQTGATEHHNATVPTKQPNPKKLQPARISRAALIARAESALENMREEFSEWIVEEVDDLSTALGQWKGSSNDPDHLHKLFRHAHDLKGQAPTLGYPIVGRIAISLCRFLSISGINAEEFIHLAQSHVHAIKATVSNEIRDESNAIALALATELEMAVSRVEATIAG